MDILINAGEKNVPSQILAFNKKLRDENPVPGYKATSALDGGALDRKLGPGINSDRTSEFGLSLPLEHWTVQAHVYRGEQAASIGFLQGLFSGSVKRVGAGVIHDAKRFSYEIIEEGQPPVEVGVAVRLSVAAEEIGAESDLTLPCLAANAQLNNLETRVGISVSGYSGFLGGRLPAPRKLDVESAALYLKAFSDLQEIVFSEQGFKHIVPTVLSYDSAMFDK